MGLEIDGGELDDDFVRQILRGALFYELICAVLAFWGSVELWRKQNYNIVLLGCLDRNNWFRKFYYFHSSRRICTYLTFQSKPEFGINEQDESW